MTLVLFFLFFSPYFFQPAQTAYNCTACEKRKCPPMIPPCPGNEAIDPCGCCHHCAKQEGDICGGPDWEIGYCDGNRKCATINGTGLVEIPDFGVCKEMPAYSKRVDYFEDDDENCPEQHGCYKMMGHCDCITKRTCIPDFQMSNYDPLDCEPWRDDPGLYDDDRVVAVAVAVAPPCTHYGCNLVENQCICESSGCDRTFEFTNIRDCYNAISMTSSRPDVRPNVHGRIGIAESAWSTCVEDPHFKLPIGKHGCPQWN
ncbi:hypothetical protein GDO78_021307 [Eleutherodactylus coqui]|uniref:IGFBP N-terminal domain-containing protein n=1 Tax=Eleutherodactylus coqui TaxID=57060 RepID=A0A8J6ENL8_ELECQ|nr:hypothetical protein GDO78_021307 [Eleutherodactylus coqui]